MQNHSFCFRFIVNFISVSIFDQTGITEKCHPINIKCATVDRLRVGVMSSCFVYEQYS